MAQNVSLVLGAPGSVENPEGLTDVPRWLRDVGQAALVGIGGATYAGALSTQDLHVTAPRELETPEEL